MGGRSGRAFGGVSKTHVAALVRDFHCSLPALLAEVDSARAAALSVCTEAQLAAWHPADWVELHVRPGRSHPCMLDAAVAAADVSHAAIVPTSMCLRFLEAYVLEEERELVTRRTYLNRETATFHHLYACFRSRGDRDSASSITCDSDPVVSLPVGPAAETVRLSCNCACTLSVQQPASTDAPYSLVVVRGTHNHGDASGDRLLMGLYPALREEAQLRFSDGLLASSSSLVYE